jgi:hypothetical protein
LTDGEGAVDGRGGRWKRKRKMGQFRREGKGRERKAAHIVPPRN